MCLRPAGDVHGRSNQDIAFKVDEPEMAARADIDVRVDARTRLREDRSELDRCREGTAALEDPRQERAAKILARHSRDERQRLSRSLERTISSHNGSTHRIGDEERDDSERRDGIRRGFQRLLHVHAGTAAASAVVRWWLYSSV